MYRLLANAKLKQLYCDENDLKRFEQITGEKINDVTDIKKLADETMSFDKFRHFVFMEKLDDNKEGLDDNFNNRNRRPYIQYMLENNRKELKKQIDNIDLQTDPHMISEFAKNLRTKESRRLYARRDFHASTEFAWNEYTSLQQIILGKITNETIEKLANQLLQDHLTFISEFSSPRGLLDDTVMLFYDAWFKIFIFANANNKKVFSKLYELAECCFKHFNLPPFYKK